MLLISCFTDLYWFIKHSLTWDLQLHHTSLDKIPKISLQAFNKFYNMVYALQGDSVDAKEFLKELNGTFNTGSCIFGVLYSNRAMMVDAKN